MMPMDLLYSFVLAVFGFAIGFIGAKMSKDILGIHHITAGTYRPAFDVATLPPGLLVFDSGGFAYLNPEMFDEEFVQDANATEAETLAVVQKPAHQSLFTEPSGLQLGSNFRHGLRCLRATTLSVLMYNVNSQNE